MFLQYSISIHLKIPLILITLRMVKLGLSSFGHSGCSWIFIEFPYFIWQPLLGEISLYYHVNINTVVSTLNFRSLLFSVLG